MQFSMRELLMGVAGVAGVFAAYSTFGVPEASALGLALGVGLAVRGRRTARSGVARAGRALSVLCGCALSLSLAGRMLFDIGPIYSRAAWPQPLELMVEIGGVNTGDAKVAGLGGFIDTEHVWRVSVRPEQLALIAAEFQLEPVSRENVPTAFWRAFPRWWRPGRMEDARFLRTPGFPATERGPDGDYYLAMYDARRQRLYVWHKFNF